MNLSRLLRTVRHLRPIQVLGKLATRLPRNGLDGRPAPPLRPVVSPWPLSSWGDQEWLDGTQRRLLGRTVALVAGDRWQAAAEPLLWRYHLHYHDHLAADLDAPAVAAAQEHLRDWLETVPAGASPAWDPYPLSRRILNWLVWQRRGHALDADHLASLAVQVRWLRARLERHVSANHLLVNAIALTGAGTLFGGPEGETWWREGMQLLRQEVTTQFLPDGGHYERSAHYHALILADLLRLLALARGAGLDDDGVIAARLPTAFAWLAAMTHGDDRVALFNDAVLSGAPPPSVLRCWARALAGPSSDATGTVRDLAASGYVRVDLGPATVWLDRAPIAPAHQPGHAHADTLTWECDLDGRRLVVDCGVSEYGAGPERLRQRGTAAHNTVVVDGQDSSEVWAGFRVGRRARILTSGQEPPHRWWAAHDGYRHLPGRPIHQRTWECHDGRLVIVDHLTGGGCHAIETGLLLHPQVEVGAITAGRVVCRLGDRPVTIILPAELAWSCEAATWHPDFNTVIPTSRLVGRGVIRLPSQWAVTLQW